MPKPTPSEPDPQATALLESLEASANELAEIGRQLSKQAATIRDQKFALLKFVAENAAPKATPVEPPQASSSVEQTRKIDGRSLPNPEKNLKISVRRCYEWAKRHRKNAEEARERVYETISKRALKVYAMRVPEGVADLIEPLYRTYENRKRIRR